MADFLFQGPLSEIDPDVKHLISLESERQYRKIILIPSESTSPLSIREALGSSFQNIYAEGYPDDEMRWMNESEILNFPARLSYYRRYSDPRYYKGVEYADILESLARRRCAEAFAANQITADDLFVNVQPLSGAPANNAVYGALIQPGDIILGMNLLHGGHLSHGSSVNRSGKLYKALHYTVDPETEKIDYDQVEQLARENHPKIIIAGYSSYPWVPDWERFRKIADSVGAYLLADVSHIAGLIAGKAIPSPVGHAHIITFTTHKTMIGPRGACIITSDPLMYKKIDRSVFPGEQGGPHMHSIAAMAVSFKLAQTERFQSLQKQIIRNAIALTNQLQSRGVRIPYGGTDTHLGNLDSNTIKGQDGSPLSGDVAARILDIAGIITNRNTIPGDKSALSASGVRYGTPWVSQRGMVESDMIEVANLMADILFATQPYSIDTRKGDALRAKINFDVLEDVKIRSRKIAEKAVIDFPSTTSGYPHHYYLDDKPLSSQDWIWYALEGENLYNFLNYAFSTDIGEINVGDSQKTSLNTTNGTVEGILSHIRPGLVLFGVESAKSAFAAAWLRALSDGYISFDQDLVRRMPGPISVVEVESSMPKNIRHAKDSSTKPYFIGNRVENGAALPEFKWEPVESGVTRRTPLFQIHRDSGAKIIPFAGWEMPVWYTSVAEEHLATRTAAGLFDVSHMGVYQVEGYGALPFLDSVCANDIGTIELGDSTYTHFLDPHANVLDDLLVYRRDKNVYLVVVNASNDDKNWAWLNAVKNGEILVDTYHPSAVVYGRNCILRNLRDPREGADKRVDIALQGPKSSEILLSLGADTETRKKIMNLKRTHLCEVSLGNFDLIVSRTGYTGEKWSYELFVHPDKAAELWGVIIKAGEPKGLKPCGLGARDSLRTEAGLPLYGHEMGGELNLGVAEAGFGSYVKPYKPWFIGRDAFIKRESERKAEVVRFRFNEKGVRMAHYGDPVIDRKGRVIGAVTSCAIDREGFLTGQAFLDLKYQDEGTQILIYQSAPTVSGKAPANLEMGDRTVIPTLATILSRF